MAREVREGREGGRKGREGGEGGKRGREEREEGGEGGKRGREGGRRGRKGKENGGERKEKTDSKTVQCICTSTGKLNMLSTQINTHVCVTTCIYQRTVLPLPFSSLSIILSKWVGERGCGWYHTQNKIHAVINHLTLAIHTTSRFKGGHKCYLFYY